LNIVVFEYIKVFMIHAAIVSCSPLKLFVYHFTHYAGHNFTVSASHT